MPVVSGPFADAEALVVAWLTARTGILTLTELDVDPDDAIRLPDLPCYHIEEAPGGAQTDPGIDVAVIDVDAYAVGRAQSRAAAELARTQLHLCRGQVFDLGDAGRVLVLNTADVSKPKRLPYDGSDVRRFGAQYRLTLQQSD